MPDVLPSRKTFRLDSRVVIHDYDADPSLNGKIGIIRSQPKKSGKQKVHIKSTGRNVVIHPSHLKASPLHLKTLVQKAQGYIPANVRMISGCDEDQESSDLSSIEKVGFRRSKRSSEMKGTEGGACTSALLKVLYDCQNTKEKDIVPFARIVTEMRKTLSAKGYQQIPQLSSSRPMTQTTPFQIVPNKFAGIRRALVIGVRYKGKPWELPGTHNDCYNMMKYLKVFHGFEDKDFTVLMDDDKHVAPTRVNMMKAFRRFAFECKPGDAAYFHFAGHGGSVPDESGDETDGLDETLYPVDYLEKGEILDDEIFEEFLLRFSKGVTLNAVVDSCHSGSVFDLPFELFGEGKGANSDFSAVRFPHMAIAKEHNVRLDNLKHDRARWKKRIPPAKRQPRTLSHSPETHRPGLKREEENLKLALGKPFPLESQVVLCGLKRNAQLNGKLGTVKSRISKGRQHVFVRGLARSFALKPANMQLPISNW